MNGVVQNVTVMCVLCVHFILFDDRLHVCRNICYTLRFYGSLFVYNSYIILDHFISLSVNSRLASVICLYVYVNRR